MAEERLIDDDKDRKYKIRKNADGEDELYIDDADDEEDEVVFPVFDVPVVEEDDESAELLTPEQYAERERLKREEEEARIKKVAAYIETAESKLREGDFEAASYSAARATELDGKNAAAHCVKLRALTRNFTDFTQAEEGAAAAESVKEYASAEQKEELKSLAGGLESLIGEVSARTEELKTQNESGKEERRTLFAENKKRAVKMFAGAAAAFGVLLILTIAFACIIFSAENGTFIILTAVCGALAFIALVATALTARVFLTARRRVNLNEKDNATGAGRKYLESKTYLERLQAIRSALDI